MPACVTDRPGPLPGEERTPALTRAERREAAAREAYPGLPWTEGEYTFDRDLNAVLVPRAWLELVECATWHVLVRDGELYVEARNAGPALVALDPHPAFEDRYLASRP